MYLFFTFVFNVKVSFLFNNFNSFSIKEELGITSNTFYWTCLYMLNISNVEYVVMFVYDIISCTNVLCFQSKGKYSFKMCATCCNYLIHLYANSFILHDTREGDYSYVYVKHDILLQLLNFSYSSMIFPMNNNIWLGWISSILKGDAVTTSYMKLCLPN